MSELTARPAPLALPGWPRSFARQAGHQLKLTLRSSRALTSALMLPILILVALRATAGGDAASYGYLVAGAVVFGSVSMAFVTHATWLVTAREKGVLKRLSATPLPRSAFLGGRILATVLLSLVAGLVTLVVARLIVGVDVPLSRTGAIVLAVLLGTVAWAALGTLLSSFISSPASAWSVLSMVYLPLMFVSGVFFSSDELPGWLDQIASWFPAAPFGRIVQAAFSGQAFGEQQVLVLAGWAVVCTVAAVVTFRWQPTEPSRKRRTTTADKTTVDS